VNLLIISHTPHFIRDGQLVGWGPTVREVDHLATLFDQVYHLAVLYTIEAPSSCLPYKAGNISFIPIRPSGGGTFADKLDILRAYFGYWRTVLKAFRYLSEKDVVHLRCPSNISLLALVYLIITRRVTQRWIKYAGNWAPEEPEPLSYRLQRWLLRNNLARSIVTINGHWENQPKHILSFYNPSLSTDDLQKIKQGSDRRRIFSPPYRLLFIGNVVEAKGAGRAVDVAMRMLSRGENIEMDIIGDGEMRCELEALVGIAGLQNKIRFHGWFSHYALFRFYKESHFILLPSRTEGWPKIISEAIAYGTVPLAARVSCIPQILQECKVGMAIDPLDVEAFIDAIGSYIVHPERWERESNFGRQATYRFTYESYLERVKSMFSEQWQLKL
jgi:glycosyltransferase involved in cell wall biosynthesis